MTTGQMLDKTAVKPSTSILIGKRIAEVQNKGFGVVEIHVRNGKVYRIKAILEDYIEDKT